MKIPPFGNTFIKNIRKDVYLFIGYKSWSKAKNFQTSKPGTLCLPAYQCPFQYKWPVKNLEVMVFDTSYV